MNIKEVTRWLGLMSVAEAERQVGCPNLYYAIERGDVPAPPVKVGLRLFYPPQAVPILKDMLDKRHLYTAFAVSKKLGVSPAKLSALAKAGLLPPGKRIGLRVFYSEADVPLIGQAVKDSRKENYHVRRQHQEGLYTQATVVAALGVPRITFQYHARRNHLPVSPQVSRGKWRYYTQADLEALRAWFAKNYQRSPQKAGRGTRCTGRTHARCFQSA